MSKDIHNWDDAFNAAYREFVEEPSTDLWEKINTSLDKKDVATYKKKLIYWKRIGVVSLLLLLGFILFEAGILKSNTFKIKQGIPSAVVKNSGKNAVTDGWQVNVDHSLNSKLTDGQSKSVFNIISGKNKTSVGMLVNRSKNILIVPTVKSIIVSPGLSNESLKPPVGKSENTVAGSVSVPGKLQHSTESLLNEKDAMPFKKSVIGKIVYDQETTLQGHTGSLDNFLSGINISKIKNNNLRVFFRPHWAITGFTSYDWANYRLDNDLRTVTIIKARETHEPSFSIGVLITRQLSHKWGLQTGLTYSKISIGISPQKIYAFNDPEGSISYKYIASSGYGYVKPGFSSSPTIGDSLIATEANHTLEFINIPLLVRYSMKKNKLTLMPGVGVAVNVKTSAKIETEVRDALHKETVSINKLNGTRSIYLSFIANAELQYNFTNKIAFNFRPAFIYAISPITKGNVVETYPYSFEAGLGISYNF